MRSTVVTSGVLGSVALLGALLYGCGDNLSGTCTDTATCAPDGSASDSAGEGDATGEGGGDANGGGDAARDSADGGAGDAPGDSIADRSDGFDGFFCDPNWTPKDNACVIADMFGVFVSPGGASGAAGTKAAPLNTVQSGNRFGEVEREAFVRLRRERMTRNSSSARVSTA